jgi:hypothetical protein
VSSEGRHTPGPWQVPSFAPWQVNSKDALPGTFVIASCHEDRHTGRTREERNANARLIAAAPDLLEAAKNALATYQAHTDAPSWLIHEMATLLGAINNAEGRE